MAAKEPWDGEHRSQHSWETHPDRGGHHRHRPHHAEAAQDHRQVRAQVGHRGLPPPEENTPGDKRSCLTCPTGFDLGVVA